MTVLQWGLLVLGAIAAVAIYVVSRRAKVLPKTWEPPTVGGVTRSPIKPPGADQMEMFKPIGQFDEYGVGRPRKRSPSMTPPQPEADGQGAQPVAATRPTAPAEPARTEPALGAEDGGKKGKPRTTAEEKIITLLIAEREGTTIFGPRIHAALAGQGLQFGDRRIYHRMDGFDPVFSVASLIKPGLLDPAEQQSFSTPGLSVFMVLPGPAQPAAAVKDMIATARKLAEALNAQVFDARRQPFTDLSASELVDDVEAWASRNFV
ncbi:MAG TPA: cell division protein ZipA C-terminal FtsZ-binding domain-containing protein [Solimonas sp.]|nr:cell division protein ZipA C-terminal FtsZ-binding domain-containing protein [Solimonas sp.]